jgi:hypothetical protein
MALHEWTRPLDTAESGALLKVAMASAERSAFRLWCRLVDMSELKPHELAAGAPPDAVVDLSDEVELAMQVLDMAYRRLSIAYFNAVGPDDPPGLDPSRSRP